LKTESVNPLVNRFVVVSRFAIILNKAFHHSGGTVFVIRYVSVSLSCENNCTDAYIQDIGALQTQTCWEVYIGGVRGKQARAGSLFCVTDNEDSTAAMMKSHDKLTDT
jgi:NAD(P)H-nitrite reductase large subunit